MRILSVIHYPTFGGPHNRNLRLAPFLEKKKIKTSILLPEELGNACPRLKEAGLHVLKIPLHRARATFNLTTLTKSILGLMPEVWAIRRILRKYSIDVVMLNGLINPHVAFAAKMENVPVVWQILDTRPPMMLRRIIMPLVTKLADVVMCTGIGVAKEHPGALGMEDRLVPFYPPVNTDRFQQNLEKRARARAEFGIPENGLLIGTVGNINPQKGHEYLIRAASILNEEIDDLFVGILGAFTPTHADYATSLRKEAHSLGLMEPTRVRFIDPGGRVDEFLPGFDVFLMTSVPHSEGIPTVILEAMACGIPVVATDVGAVSEVVENGVTGFVVSPLDPQAIAHATLRLLQDPVLRRSMGEVGRLRAVERYDVEVCADTHIRAFEAALRHHRMRKR